MEAEYVLVCVSVYTIVIWMRNVRIRRWKEAHPELAPKLD